MSTALPPLPAGTVLRPYVDLLTTGTDERLLRAGIERIFRSTAARWPAELEAAARFQNLWLDQYLEHEPDLAMVALARETPNTADDVLGYLVGCRIDPATSPRFTSLGYFQDFAPLTARYPAHLHVNLDARARGQGIGAHLVEALCARLSANGVTGVHVVTARDQRNVGFYQRLEFVELAQAPRGATEVLFLARGL